MQMNSVRTVRRFLLQPLWLFLALPAYVGWRLLSAMSIGPAAGALSIALLVGVWVFFPFTMRARTGPRIVSAFLRRSPAYAWYPRLRKRESLGALIEE